MGISGVGDDFGFDCVVMDISDVIICLIGNWLRRYVNHLVALMSLGTGYKRMWFGTTFSDVNTLRSVLKLS